MPLYKTLTPNSQTTVKIWKITESFNELLAPLSLSKVSLERVLGMKSELHQRGFLSVRHLLTKFGYTDADLWYDDYGKPHLEDGNYISITHSFTYSGVIISDEPIGIDIEKQRQKIKLIANKFIGYEHEYLDKSSKNHVRNLTVIWCVKESLYKLFATPGLSFKQHTLVIPFSFQDDMTVSWIDYNTTKYRYLAHYLEFDGFTCAYVTS